MSNGNLILTRNQGQKIMIGDDIEIVVMKISGKQASISISAPKDVPVYREEIYLKMQDEKRTRRNKGK